MPRPKLSNEPGRRARGRPARDAVEFHDPIGDPPPRLSALGAEYWRVYGPLLEGAGVAKRADAAALVQLCEVSADIESTSGQIAREGRTITTATGRQVPHPLLPELRALRSQQLALLARFGLVPADRGRVSVTPKVAEDPAAKYFT